MKSSFPIVELGSYIQQISQRNRTEADIEVFSVTNSEGFTRSTDYFSKEVFSKNVSNYKVVSPEQFAYNPSRINVGSIDYLRHNTSVLVSPLYIVFECKKDIYADYLLRYLKSNWGNIQIRANTEGTVRDSLKFKGLENIKLPLPPLNEQIQIAYLLGKVEDLIVKRKQHLQQIDDLLKSIFLDIFGNVALNTKAWFIDSLSNLGEFKNGLNYGKGEAGVEIKCLGVGDFKAFSKINNMDDLSTISLNQKPSDDYFLQNGDLLFVRSNGNKDLVGRCIVVYPNDEEVTYSGFCIRLRLNENALNPTYLAHLFRAVAFRRLILQGGQGANIQNISQKSLTELPIPVPPLETQNLFASFVEKVEGVTALYKESLTDLESLYGTLSQQAFKGELDLSRIKPPTQRIKVSATEDLSVVSTATTLKQLPTINLSNPNCPAEELYAKDGLRKLIIEWVETYRTQLANEAFSIERFMTAVQNRLMELYPDNEFEMGANEYEYIKEWVFLELEAGRLEQSRNVNSNMIELRAVQS